MSWYERRKNMENNFSLKMYLEGYENVVKKANDLVAVDLDGRKK